MKSLRQILVTARAERHALGHFNIGDFTMLQGVFQAAKALETAVMVGFSEGERKFLGVHQCAAMVKSLRDDYQHPIFLSADHTHTLDSAIQVAKAGFDSIVLDLSALPLAENIRQMQHAIPLLKAINPLILIEGEIGDIGIGSDIHDDMTDQAKDLTTPEDAAYFVQQTGVDNLAPAVGSKHGMSRDMVEGKAKKRLNINRIRQISKVTNAFLTLHGGSGTADADFVAAIEAGVSVVHINTELRVAWKEALKQTINASNTVVPYQILPVVVSAVEMVARSRLSLFSRRDIEGQPPQT